MNDTQNKILIIDDEPGIRLVLSKGLERKGYFVDKAEDISEAREWLNENPYFLLFVDINLPDGSGLDLLEKIVGRPNNPSVIVMTAEATMDNAVKAMQKGAFDYMTKPFDLQEVELLVKKVEAYRESAGEQTELPRKLQKSAPNELIGHSPAMQSVFKLIGRLADSDLTILITGPTGAGKELVARALHFNSSRKHSPFVAVNCAAIPTDLLESELFGHIKGAFTGAVEDKKGKFAMADKGVILLDEVGEMPLALQAKLLRVLQEKEFYPVGAVKPVVANVRVIASTNLDLQLEVEEKRFREDLYHRINVAIIELPALNERKKDVERLALHFLQKCADDGFGNVKRLEEAALNALIRYDWPGNVRELENVIQRATLMTPGDVITIDHLPPIFSEEPNGARPCVALLPDAIREAFRDAPEGKVYGNVIALVEKELIQSALIKSGGAQTGAAKILGINRNTLAKKIGELGIDIVNS